MQLPVLIWSLTTRLKQIVCANEELQNLGIKMLQPQLLCERNHLSSKLILPKNCFYSFAKYLLERN